MDKEILMELSEHCDSIRADCTKCEKKDVCKAYDDELADKLKH